MNDTEVGGVVVGIMLIMGVLVSAITLTQDDTRVNLKAISEMTAKCKDNDGLDIIQHDYDVLCKNGAYFEYERL